MKKISTDNAGNLFVATTTDDSANNLHSIRLAADDALTGTERSLSQIPVSSGVSFLDFMFDRTGNLYTLNRDRDYIATLTKYNISGIKEWSMSKSDTFSASYATVGNDNNIYAVEAPLYNVNSETSIGKFSPISNFL
ncbi:hypothetical protein ACE1CI_10145 [Aerosakkonemataceae cyanobacterium BLCC-F50]|uniref:Uncharacterized protein n=1 Tax=Floridaenema flaviceps BLCC-F50 TaxID=3153642 RepID=A0ABV4XP95_9CYAN